MRLLYRFNWSVPAYLRHAMSVNGGTTVVELRALHMLASQVKQGVIVEIGSYHGRSTVALAYGSRSNANIPVIAIDPHQEFEGELGAKMSPRDRAAFFRNNLRSKITDVVSLINLPSQLVVNCWKQPIGLLWIDGDHSYEMVKQDFEKWSPFVVEGGIIALHDSTHEELGPYIVVKQALSSAEYENVEVVDRITILRKLPQTSHVY